MAKPFDPPPNVAILTQRTVWPVCTGCETQLRPENREIKRTYHDRQGIAWQDVRCRLCRRRAAVYPISEKI